MLLWSNCLTRRFAPCLVRVNTIPHFTRSSLMSCTSNLRLSAFLKNIILCSIRSTVISLGLTSTMTALFRNEPASLAIDFGIVALNSRFCRLFGRSLRTFSMSRMNPISSILSASSRTKNSTLVMSTKPWPMRSRSRPGVATRISRPFCNARTWGFCLTPPKITRCRISMCSL